MGDTKDFKPIDLPKSKFTDDDFLTDLRNAISINLGIPLEMISSDDSEYFRHIQERRARDDQFMYKCRAALFKKLNIQNESDIEKLYEMRIDGQVVGFYKFEEPIDILEYQCEQPDHMIDEPLKMHFSIGVIDNASTMSRMLNNHIQEIEIPIEFGYNKEYISNVIDMLEFPITEDIVTLPYIEPDVKKTTPNFEIFMKNQHRYHIKKKKKKGKTK